MSRLRYVFWNPRSIVVRTVNLIASLTLKVEDDVDFRALALNLTQDPDRKLSIIGCNTEFEPVKVEITEYDTLEVYELLEEQ
jgi:lipoate-protein ligase B